MQNPSTQKNGSIIDSNGNPISFDDRDKIISDVNDLPISKKVDDIIHAIDNSPIILLEGATGSGKSTQVSKIGYNYLLNSGFKNPKVSVNQPRVAAATGLAKRVSEELLCETGDNHWSLGKGIGYNTGRGKVSSAVSNILYQTSGYELMRLSGGGNFPDLIVLDEFHTDAIDNTLLAYILKEELKKYNKKFKLIIASATINRLKTLDYFKEITRDMPIISVEGRTFPTEKIEVNKGDFEKTFIERYSMGENILIFEQGKNEIKKRIKSIESLINVEDTKVLSFHSELSILEQREILDYIPKENEKVVIVATNSAEESLTVNYLDTVIDLGKQKDSSYNKYGVERLDSKDVSKASHMQRIGRVGRVKEGNGYLVSDKSFDDLDDFSMPPITKTTLEKEILILLKKGLDLSGELSKCNSNNQKLFVDNPDENLVNLSYKKLYRLGAIDKKGITKIGEKLLNFPLSVFNSRVLLESMERGVSEDVLGMVSILENNGFLFGRGLWKDLFEKSKTKFKYSDLFFQFDLLKDFLSKDLDEDKLNFYSDGAKLGFDWRGLYSSGDFMLFENIDEEVLEEFGVNKRSLEKISETISDLKLRFEENNIKLTNTGTKDDIIISLLSGNLDNIFKYDNNEKLFFNEFINLGDLKFKIGNTSIINPNETSKDNYYIGNPFIIGGIGGEDDDFNLLHSITIANESHIKEFYNILKGKVPNFDFEKRNELQIAKNEYLKTLEGFPKFKNIDINGEKEKIVKNNIKNLDNTSDEYLSIINFLENLNNDKRKESKNSLSTLKILEKEITDLMKKKGFIKSFLENIDDVLSGKNINISKISLGISSNKSLLIFDPIISKYDFLKNCSLLNSDNKEINKVFKILEFNKKENTKFSRCFKKLFFNNSKTYRVGEKHYQELISKIEEKIESNNSILQGKQAEKNERSVIDRENKKLRFILKKINQFLNITLNTRECIDNIKFDEITYCHKDNKSFVYTKKFLYSILGDLIFNGDFLDDKQKAEISLKKRINSNLGKHIDLFNEDEIVHTFKVLSGKEINDQTRKNAMEKLSSYKDKINLFYESKIKKDFEDVLSKIDYIKNNYITTNYKNLISIISSVFDDDFVFNNKARIFDFSKKLHQLNTINFDQNLFNFIKSLSFESIEKYGEKMEEIDDYLYWKDYIENYHLSKLKKQIENDELDISDIKQEILNLEKALKNVEKFKF